MKWEDYVIKINGVKLTNLRFTDDVVIVASTLTELETIIRDLCDESALHGLSMNYSETKILSSNQILE